jgi:uncharacterized membrane protein
MSLLTPDDHWLVFASLALLAWVAFRLETTRLGSRLSSAIIALLLAMIAANLGLLPAQSAVYDLVWQYVLPFGIAMLLLRANLHALLRETGRLALLFFAGSAATVAGALTAHALLPDFPHKTELAGVLTASYIGGSVNFLATARVLGLDQQAEFLAAGMAADNLVMALYFMGLFALAGRPRLVQAFADRARAAAEPVETACPPTSPSASAADLAQLVGLAALLCGLGRVAAAWTPFAGADLLWTSALSLGFALAFARHLPAHAPDRELGALALQFLFLVIGASASLPAVLRVGGPLVLFILILLTVHLALLLAAGWLLRFRLEEVLLCSNANAGGPTTAAAMAGALHWQRLVVPAVLCGILGYSVANFIGLAVARALSP